MHIALQDHCQDWQPLAAINLPIYWSKQITKNSFASASFFARPRETNNQGSATLQRAQPQLHLPRRFNASSEAYGAEPRGRRLRHMRPDLVKVCHLQPECARPHDGVRRLWPWRPLWPYEWVDTGNEREEAEDLLPYRLWMHPMLRQRIAQLDNLIS